MVKPIALGLRVLAIFAVSVGPGVVGVAEGAGGVGTRADRASLNRETATVEVAARWERLGLNPESAPHVFESDVDMVEAARQIDVPLSFTGA